MRDARVVMHVGIAYPLRRGKRSRHSRRMRTRNFTYLASSDESISDDDSELTETTDSDK